MHLQYIITFSMYNVYANIWNNFCFSTYTSVRNSELSFKLDEPFTEETVDGRKTDTIATRVGKCNKTYKYFENND